MDNITGEVWRFANAHMRPYKRHGSRELAAKYCPICSGGQHSDTYTFSINLDTGLANCMRGSCGYKGSLEDLADRLGFAMEYIRERHKPMQQKPKKVYHPPKTKLVPITEECVKYLATRKISRETIEAFRLMSDEQGNIAFPFYQNDKLIFLKFRKPRKPIEKEPKEWQESETKPILFGMDACSFSKPLVITEGQIDAMAVYEAGYTNVVSVPSGASNMDWVDACWDWLEKFDSIILFGDNDEPGRQMVHDLSKRLDESRCRIVEEYPEREDGSVCKDANEVLYFHGALEIMDMIDNANEIPIRGVIDLADVVPIDPTTLPRIATGIPALDETLGGLHLPGVTVITGESGAGKSTISGPLLLNAIEQGYSVCAYSGELSKERFQTWINYQCAGSKYITLKYDPIRKKQVPFVPQSVISRLVEYYRGKFFLFDNKEIFDNGTGKAVIEVFTMMARRHGCKLFLVDNMMTITSGDEDEENAAQARFMNMIMSFSIKFGVHVLIVAHPRKRKAGEAIRKDDVSGNSVIVKLADNLISIEKPDIRVIKNRDEGVEKLIPCMYAPDSRRIYQLDKGDLYDYSWDKSGLEPANPRADSLPEYRETGADLPFGH